MQRWTGWVLGRLADTADTLHIRHERAAERRQLLTLDDRMLRDIGISRADAVNEAGGKVARVVCLVDRGEGAVEAFAERGLILEPLFTRADLGV